MADPSRPGGVALPELKFDSTGMEVWFKEQAGIGLESSLTLRVESILTHFKSPFQDIAVLQTRGYGRMLVLDGVIQVTEFDESGYQEMITHVPLLCHPDPRRVLIVGGGDGGAVREALKHPGVEEVVLCELDEDVVRVCREFLPSLAQSLDDPRVKIVYQDGAVYMVEHRGSFDAVIVDSTDPVGPAQVLFKRPFYENIAVALKPGGVAVTQAETYFYQPQVIRALFSFIPDLFPLAAYYHTAVPTYPSGLIGFAFCSTGPRPLEFDPARAARLPGLEYYSPAVHRAAFALPPRAMNLLPESVKRHQA